MPVGPKVEYRELFQVVGRIVDQAVDAVQDADDAACEHVLAQCLGREADVGGLTRREVAGVGDGDVVERAVVEGAAVFRSCAVACWLEG